MDALIVLRFSIKPEAAPPRPTNENIGADIIPLTPLLNVLIVVTKKRTSCFSLSLKYSAMVNALSATLERAPGGSSTKEVVRVLATTMLRF